MTAKTLRILALALIVAAAAVWLATGANAGWTKTSVPKETLDSVTGITGITYDHRLVPGIDFLGAAALGSTLLAGASFFIGKPPAQTKNANTYT